MVPSQQANAYKRIIMELHFYTPFSSHHLFQKKMIMSNIDRHRKRKNERRVSLFILKVGDLEFIREYKKTNTRNKLTINGLD